MQNRLITLLTFVLLCTGQQVFSQSGGIKFGKIDKEYLEMTSYEKDTGAVAVILADYGNAYFRYNNSKGFQYIFVRHRRIKIFKKDGYEWANQSINLYHDGMDEESVSALKGYTYNLSNGKLIKTKLEKESIFTEKFDDNHNIKKFTMPNVSEGSVIEYTYTITSDFDFRLRDWYFQYSIPVMYSEYRAKIPEYYTYKNIQQGYLILDVNEQGMETGQLTVTSKTRDGSGMITSSSQNNVNYQNIVYKWAIYDVPAMTSESFITNINDYRSKMELEISATHFGNGSKLIMDTWETLNQRYMEQQKFGQQLSRKGFLKPVASTLAAKESDPQLRIKAAVDHIKDKIEWNGRYSEFSNNIKKAYELGTGTSGDINLTLVVLLRELGFDANPVIFSTRSHERIHPIYPIATKFNNVVACVNIDGKYHLFDATDKFVPYNVLPFDYLREQGRLISESKTEWVPLTAYQKSQTYTMVNLKFSEEESFSGLVTTTRSGYEAIRSRKKINELGESEYQTKLVKNYEELGIEEYQINNFKKIDQSLEEKYQINLSDYATFAGNMIYIDPMLAYGLKENPLKIEKRLYPVDQGAPFRNTYVLTIEIPQGYVVEELPKPAVVALPGKAGMFRYVVTQTGNTISLTSTYQIRKSMFLPEEYEHIKSYYNNIINKQAEQIVFKKST